MAMTAVNKGFRTRAQLQLRAPRSVSHNITPSLGGSAGHWNGGPTKITPAMDHSKCEAHWRADQDYHMDTKGWVDIAYTGGFCQHGICLAGRGFGVRTAANGTNVGNQNYYAFCWIGGLGETPSVDAINAFEWWVNEARLAGKAGMRVQGHNSLFATVCPGPILKAECLIIDNKALALPLVPLPLKPPVFTKPTLPAPNATVMQVQKAVRVFVNGKWGDATDKGVNAVRCAALIGWEGNRYRYGVKYLQARVGTTVDGDAGPKTKAALRTTVVNLQRAVGAVPDGAWGPASEAKWWALRTKFYKY